MDSVDNSKLSGLLSKRFEECLLTASQGAAYITWCKSAKYLRQNITSPETYCQTGWHDNCVWQWWTQLWRISWMRILVFSPLLCTVKQLQFVNIHFTRLPTQPKDAEHVLRQYIKNFIVHQFGWYRCNMYCSWCERPKNLRHAVTCQCITVSCIHESNSIWVSEHCVQLHLDFSQSQSRCFVPRTNDHLDEANMWRSIFASIGELQLAYSGFTKLRKGLIEVSET